MSRNDVLNRWPTYQGLIKTVFSLINDPSLMSTAVANFGPFPSDPSAWDRWLSAYEGLAALEDAVKVTDAALQKMADFVAATNSIAAAVKLAAPGNQEIGSLIAQLNIVNEAIQQDQRFHAALTIAKVLVSNISSTLKK